MKCRFCSSELSNEFVDLGFSPPSNSFLEIEDLNKPEVYYPLRILLCNKCYLVQIDEFAKHNDIFNCKYLYFSSFSTSWLTHASEYVEMMMSEYNIGPDSLVVEIASNDGYLLQYFVQKKVPVLGIEPTSNTAELAISRGVNTIVDFFGKSLANKLSSNGIKANLILGNNVLAHVPDIKDFVGGLPILLKEEGIITFEFPHLLNLIKLNQFDTIYHEHFSYLSLLTVNEIFIDKGLVIFKVQELPTHGGSLRIFATKISNLKNHPIENSVVQILEKEKDAALNSLEGYSMFQEKAEKVKDDFIQFLLNSKKNKKSVIAYGAAAKGVTLLNFCGVRKDLLSFVVDASPYKIGKFLPGIHIPVLEKKYIEEIKPNYIVILPWNLKEEIVEQLAYTREWGCRFVIPIPDLTII
jgi:hypothetical protein